MDYFESNRINNPNPNFYLAGAGNNFDNNDPDNPNSFSNNPSSFSNNLNSFSDNPSSFSDNKNQSPDEIFPSSLTNNPNYPDNPNNLNSYKFDHFLKGTPQSTVKNTLDLTFGQKPSSFNNYVIHHKRCEKILTLGPRSSTMSKVHFLLLDIEFCLCFSLKWSHFKRNLF